MLVAVPCNSSVNVKLDPIIKTIQRRLCQNVESFAASCFRIAKGYVDYTRQDRIEKAPKSAETKHVQTAGNIDTLASPRNFFPVFVFFGLVVVRQSVQYYDTEDHD